MCQILPKHIARDQKPFRVDKVFELSRLVYCFNNQFYKKLGRLFTSPYK